MRTKIHYILMLAVTALLASCQSEQDPFNLSADKGSFSLNLKSGEINVYTDTRGALKGAQADNYLISVFQGYNELWAQKKKYKDLTGSDYMLSVGSGYSVYAESCTEEDAETSNDGFGSKRFAGKSDAFAIEVSKTTPVSVSCTATNGGLCVVFDKSFTDVFGNYYVETLGNRQLRFDATNKAIFTKEDGKDIRTGGAVAYYNMPPSGEVEVELEIHARGAQVTEKKVLVKLGKITRFTVYGPNAGTGDNTGGIDIIIGYDDDYDNSDENIVVD